MRILFGMVGLCAYAINDERAIHERPSLNDSLPFAIEPRMRPVKGSSLMNDLPHDIIAHAHHEFKEFDA